jgi:hypothetical protein
VVVVHGVSLVLPGDGEMSLEPDKLVEALVPDPAADSPNAAGRRGQTLRHRRTEATSVQADFLSGAITSARLMAGEAPVLQAQIPQPAPTVGR